MAQDLAAGWNRAAQPHGGRALGAPEFVNSSFGELFVNRSFRELFTGGVPATAPLIVKSDGVSAAGAATGMP